jgi:hypothetical protein
VTACYPIGGRNRFAGLGVYVSTSRATGKFAASRWTLKRRIG